MVLEKRLRNLDTAEGGGVLSLGGRIVTDGCGAGGGPGAAAGDAPDVVGDSGDAIDGAEVWMEDIEVLEASILGRGEEDALPEADLVGEVNAFSAGGVEVPLPKNDSKPPPGLGLVCVVEMGTSSSFGTTRQPAGTKSIWESGLAFTEASHAVEPFEDA